MVDSRQKETPLTETRTIILALDGRTVTLGRFYQPTSDEIEAARVALAQQGVTAWLATMDGNPYATNPPRLTEVTPLVGEGSFADAVAAYLDARASRLAETQAAAVAPPEAPADPASLGGRIQALADALLLHPEWPQSGPGLNGMLTVADMQDAAALAYVLEGNAPAGDAARQAAASIRSMIRFSLDHDEATADLRREVRAWLTARAGGPPSGQAVWP